jgi:hypothetical protein
MARYFFNCEGAQTFQDREGIEMDDLQAVRLQAVQNASDVMRDHADAFIRPTNWRVQVEDEAGRTVFVLTLQTQVGVEPE